MELNKLKENLIKNNKKFRKEYLKDDLAFGISRLVSNLRAYEEIDQTKLARLVGTKQSGISRLERGNTLPSLSFVQKIATKLNYKIQISFISNKTGSIFNTDGSVNIPQVEIGIIKQRNRILNSNSQTIFTDIKSPYYSIPNCYQN